MRKKILFAMALAMLLAWPLGSAFAYEAMIGPTGVLQYDKNKSYGGYTLWSSTNAGNTRSYLMDMEGYVVHEWKTDYVVALHEQLLANGNIVRQQKPWAGQAAADAVVPVPKYGPVKLQQQTYNGAYITVGGGHAGLLQEFDWDGNLVWEYERNTSTSVSHHTFTRHPTAGTTLILGWEYKSRDEAIAQGRNPATVGPRGMWPDYITEINNATKAVVWEFHVWDNLIQNFDSTKPHYGQPKDNLDKFDINWICAGAATETGIPDWTHWNTANYNMNNANQIAANSRHWGESYIIDRGTGGKGKLIWRFGNPSAYGMGVAPYYQQDGTQLDWGPHHAHFIDPGLPGAGNMLILDNGWNRPAGNRTRTIEVDVTKPSNGTALVSYSALGTTTTFPNLHPGTIVWQYFSGTPNSLYSASQCSNQRLPNGNTVITSTQSTGHIIEVTKGEQNTAGNWVNKLVVWEFIIPILFDSDAGNGYGVYQTDTLPSIHRSIRYGVDYAGLQGRDLSRKYHISSQPEFWKMLNNPKVLPASLKGDILLPTGWQPLTSAVPSLYTGFGFGAGGSASGGGGGAGGGAGGGGGGY
jgi:hypothetical protein